MKLVIYDPNGHLYVRLLRKALETRWDIVQHPAENPSWLERHLPDADALIALSPTDRKPAEGIPAPDKIYGPDGWGNCSGAATLSCWRVLSRRARAGCSGVSSFSG